MVIIKYYNFSIFVLYLKQLKNHGSYNPKFTTTFNITYLQIAILLFFLFLIDYLDYYSSTYLKPTIYSLAIIIYVYNYFIYIKGNRLDEIHKQFESSDMNTIQNRRLTLTLIMLILFTCIFMIILLSYLKSVDIYRVN